MPEFIFPIGGKILQPCGLSDPVPLFDIFKRTLQALQLHKKREITGHYTCGSCLLENSHLNADRTLIPLHVNGVKYVYSTMFAVMCVPLKRE